MRSVAKDDDFDLIEGSQTRPTIEIVGWGRDFGLEVRGFLAKFIIVAEVLRAEVLVKCDDFGLGEDGLERP